MEQHFKDLGESDFRLYKAMQEWHNRIGDMLVYVNDVLNPHGFDEIVKYDFAVCVRCYCGVADDRPKIVLPSLCTTAHRTLLALVESFFRIVASI